MGFVVDILVEAFFELFGEGFIYLSSAFVSDKVLSEKARQVISIIFFAIACALFIGLVVGIFMIVGARGQSFWGWLLVSLSIIYLIFGIVLKVISYIKKR